MLIWPDQKPATSLATDQTSVLDPALSLSALCNIEIQAESVHTEPATRLAIIMLPNTVEDTLPSIIRRRRAQNKSESIDRTQVQCAIRSSCYIPCREFGDVRHIDGREVLNCRGLVDGDPGVRQACTSNVLLRIF